MPEHSRRAVTPQDSESSFALTVTSLAGAVAAWAVARWLVPGRDVLLALIAAWGVMFRLWQRSSPTDPKRYIYYVAGILLLVAALIVTIAR